MTVITRRRAAILRWNQLRLPHELVQNIMIEILQEILHTALLSSGENGTSFGTNKSWFYPSNNIHRRAATVPGQVLLFEQTHQCLIFRPILHLLHACRQYRMVMGRMLMKLFPESFAFDKLTRDEMPYAIRAHIDTRTPKYLDCHPILGSLRTLQEIGMYCMEVRRQCDLELEPQETFFASVNTLQETQKNPIAWFYLLHARLEASLEMQFDILKQSEARPEVLDNLLDEFRGFAKNAPSIYPWQCVLLHEVVAESCQLYRLVRLAITAVRFLSVYDLFLRASQHWTIDFQNPEETPEKQVHIHAITHLRDLIQTGTIKRVKFFCRQLRQGFGFPNSSPVIVEEWHLSLKYFVIRLEMEEVNARAYLRYGIGFITPAWSEFLQEFVKLTATLIQLFKAELSVVGEQ